MKALAKFNVTNEEIEVWIDNNRDKYKAIQVDTEGKGYETAMRTIKEVIRVRKDRNSSKEAQSLLINLKRKAQRVKLTDIAIVSPSPHKQRSAGDDEGHRTE